MDDDFQNGRGFDRTAVNRFINRAEIMLGMVARQDSTKGYYLPLSDCYESLLSSCVMFPLKSSGEVMPDHSYFTPFLDIIEAFLYGSAELDGLKEEMAPEKDPYYRTEIKETYLNKSVDMLFGALGKTLSLLDKLDAHINETSGVVDCHGLDTSTKYGLFRNNVVRLLGGLELSCGTAIYLTGGFEPSPSNH